MPGLNDLPNDILEVICDCLDDPELWCLLSANRRFHSAIQPRVYKSLVVHCDGRFWRVPTSLLSLVREDSGIAAMIEDVKIVRRIRQIARLQPRSGQSMARRSGTTVRRRRVNIFAGIKAMFGTGVLSLLKRLPNLTRLTVDIHFARSKRLRWREFFGMKPKLPGLLHLSLRDEWQHLVRARELASCCEYGLRCIEGWTGATSWLETLHISGAFEDTIRPVKFHHGRLLPVEALHLETTQFSFESLQNLLLHLDGLRYYRYTYVGRQIHTPAPKHVFSLQPHKDTLQQLEFDMPCVDDGKVYGRFKEDLRSFPALKVLKTAWSTVSPPEAHRNANNMDDLNAGLIHQLPSQLEQLTLTCCKGYVYEQLEHLLLMRSHCMPSLHGLTISYHRPPKMRFAEASDTMWTGLQSGFSAAGMSLQVQPCSPHADTTKAFDWAQLQDNARWEPRGDRTSSMHAQDSDSTDANSRDMEARSSVRRERQHKNTRASDAPSFTRKLKHDVAAATASTAQRDRGRQKAARTSEASSYLRPPGRFSLRRGRDNGHMRSNSGQQSETASLAGDRRSIVWPPLSERREMGASEAAVVASSRRRQRLSGSSAYGPYINTMASMQ